MAACVSSCPVSDFIDESGICVSQCQRGNGVVIYDITSRTCLISTLYCSFIDNRINGVLVCTSSCDYYLDELCINSEDCNSSFFLAKQQGLVCVS